MRLVRALASICLLPAFAAAALAQEMPKDCPMMQSHEKTKGPSASVMEHGGTAMGFDQVKTTHHFFLKSDGGVIQVTANDAGDSASRDMIQTHLKHIAAAFSEGDFAIPMLVHDRVPPGVAEMKQLKEKIHYRYEALDMGGRVVIQTDDASALAAVHEFLRFQIQDHATGDSLKLK